VLSLRLVVARWGWWLIETDPPVQAEVAVVLGGGEGERLGAAVAIWREGRVGAILITGPDKALLPVYTGEDSLTQGEVKRRIAVKRGVPDERAWLALGPTSTYEEAVRVRAELEGRAIRRAIVVTSPFHSRRARRTFLRVFDGSGIALSTETLPLEKSEDDPHGWWTREHDLMSVVNETVKVLFYWRRHGVRPF
jgi:uncharacterized SAM-binding protein YcdF (DUF218 family)